MAMAAKASKAHKVGDRVDVKGSAFVRLPDGSVVSTRDGYEFTREGVHVVAGVEYTVEK